MTAGFRVEWTDTATRDLARLDAATRRRVLAAIGRLTEDPPTGDARRLRGPGEEW